MKWLKSHHPVMTWLLVVCLLAYAYYQSRLNYQIWNYNELIAEPQTIAGDYDDLPAQVIFAKARYLNQQGDYQQALRAYAHIEQAGDRSFRLQVQYNMGVVYLQQAAKLWRVKGVWESSQINTLLDLAEEAFKTVLFEDPDNASARYNLEYALRIRPPAKVEEEAQWQKSKRSIHAIMPGVPGGGP